MKDFKSFIFHNNLSQKEVIEYLGVSKGYMSLVISGKKKLSGENFRKLLENPYGWDVSMLTQDECENAAPDKVEESGTIDRLLSIIEGKESQARMLLAMIKEKDEQIEELRRELDARKKEAALSAESSSAADAV